MADFINVERQQPTCPTSTQKKAALENSTFSFCAFQTWKGLVFVVRLLIFRAPLLPPSHHGFSSVGELGLFRLDPVLPTIEMHHLVEQYHPSSQRKV